jgi:hypothetical protein
MVSQQVRSRHADGQQSPGGPIWNAYNATGKMAYPIPMRTDFGQKVRYGNAQILGIRIGHQTAYAMGL